MPWFKLAGEGAFHAKVIEAGNEAYGAWTRAGQWSSEHLTEGRVPRATALAIGPAKLWAKLVAAKAGHEHGLAVETPDGWEIHDYLSWNPDAGEVLERRKARSEAGRRGGQKSAAARQAKPKQTPSKRSSKTEANAQANAQAKLNDCPTPSPYPEEIPLTPAPRGDLASPPEAGSGPDPEAPLFAPRRRSLRDQGLAPRDLGTNPRAEDERARAEEHGADDEHIPLTILAPPPPSGLDTSPDAVAAAQAHLDRFRPRPAHALPAQEGPSTAFSLPGRLAVCATAEDAAKVPQ